MFEGPACIIRTTTFISLRVVEWSRPGIDSSLIPSAQRELSIKRCNFENKPIPWTNPCFKTNFWLFDTFRTGSESTDNLTEKGSIWTEILIWKWRDDLTMEMEYGSELNNGIFQITLINTEKVYSPTLPLSGPRSWAWVKWSKVKRVAAALLVGPTPSTGFISSYWKSKGIFDWGNINYKQPHLRDHRSHLPTSLKPLRPHPKANSS